MKIVKKILALSMALCLICLCSCSEKEAEKKVERFSALNTYVTVTTYGDNCEEAAQKVKEKILEYDEKFSINGNGSLSKINSSNGGELEIDSETAELLSKALELGKETNGIFDVSIYPLVSAWGFYSGDFRIPSQEEISSLLEKVDYSRIELDGDKVKLSNGSKLDLGGCAKGYIGDKSAEFLKEIGTTSAIISLGGNIRTLGSKPSSKKWSVGIQDPDDSGTYFCVLEIDETNVISSGAYQNNFKGDDGNIYHHIIDPKTGMPAQSDLKEVTVVCKDGTKADAYSTAFYIMGLEKALEKCKSDADIEAVFLTKDNKVIVTKGLEKGFSLNEGYDYDVTIS